MSLLLGMILDDLVQRGCAFAIDGGAPTTVSELLVANEDGLDPELVRVLGGLPVGGAVDHDMGAHGVLRLERVS